MSEDIPDDENPEYNGRITVLFDSDGLRIAVKDESSSATFLEVKLNKEQTCEALSRLMSTPCRMETRNLERVGKVMEMDKISFPLPSNSAGNDKELALMLVDNHVPDGWIADKYFGSQDSFTFKDGERTAHTIIRRWVDKGES